MKKVALMLVVAMLVPAVPVRAEELEHPVQAAVATVLLVGKQAVSVWQPAAVLGAMESSAIVGIGLAMIVGIVREVQTDPAKRGLRRYEPGLNAGTQQVTVAAESQKWARGANGLMAKAGTGGTEVREISYPLSEDAKWEREPGTLLTRLKGYPTA